MASDFRRQKKPVPLNPELAENVEADRRAKDIENGLEPEEPEEPEPQFEMPVFRGIPEEPKPEPVVPKVVKTEAEKSNSDLPWYLQVAPPTSMQNPHLQKQQLPELPPSPPPRLEPILQHLSVEIGLDDLTLIDLRKLEPPSGLGSNLIMVFGTARSEKHLHVSADRFCRWLRSEYKLKPYADGLIGRNELKLRMKRRNKRLKLLGTVKSKASAVVDDGLTTSWVCCNVGAFDTMDPLEKGPKKYDASFVGFQDDNDDPKLVVQMMTGERRDELELEKLWNQALARQSRREWRISQGLSPDEDIEDEDQSLDSITPNNTADSQPVTLLDNEPGSEEVRV